MRQTNVKKVNNVLIFILMFSVFASLSYSKNETPETKPINVKKQTDLAFTCPAEVVFQIQEIPDWSAGILGLKKLSFESASADRTTMYCTYESKEGSSVLMRPVPQGYVCSVKKDGTRTRFINCKRNVPPIKTKPENK